MEANITEMKIVTEKDTGEKFNLDSAYITGSQEQDVIAVKYYDDLNLVAINTFSYNQSGNKKMVLSKEKAKELFQQLKAIVN